MCQIILFLRKLAHAIFLTKMHVYGPKIFLWWQNDYKIDMIQIFMYSIARLHDGLTKIPD